MIDRTEVKGWHMQRLLLASCLPAHLQLQKLMDMQGQGQAGYGASGYGYGEPLRCNLPTLLHVSELLRSGYQSDVVASTCCRHYKHESVLILVLKSGRAKLHPRVM